ncbi:MAG: hypothetical protein HKN87_14215 [Saprospiraceae bacterium]|nr:hypothetical protein [Saprospiraceae bacterium]
MAKRVVFISKVYALHIEVLAMILAVCILSGCLPDEQARDANKPFFDLAGYISQSIADSQYVTVSKTVVIGGVEEIQEITDYPYWKDLKRFEGFDINRPALFDKYTSDTLQELDHQVMKYEATEPKLHVQSLEIQTRADEVVKIQVHSKSESFLENLDIIFTWIPEEKYSYEKSSDKLFGDRQKQEVRVAFLK